MKTLFVAASRSSERTWLALILLVGLLLRAMAIGFYTHVPESDELAYIAMAKNLLAGTGMVDIFGNRAMYNMGYPLFVLTPTFYLFDGSVLAARVVNAALGGVSIYLCYALAREMGMGKTGRLLAAALWALYLPAALYSVYILKESLLIPMMLGLLWCAVRTLRYLSLPVSLGIGVLSGLVALTGNAGLALVPALVFALLRTPASLRTKAVHAGIAFLCAGLIASPWLMRNMEVLGAPVLNTNGGFNLYLGNNTAATGMFMSIADTPLGAQWEDLRLKGEVHASTVLRDAATSWIASHPSEALLLSIKKLGMFWTPPFHAGEDDSSTAVRLVRLVWAVQFVVLLVAALGSLLLKQGRSRQAWTLWLALAAYTAVHMIFYVIYRYREPIMPIACVLAAMTLAYILERNVLKTTAEGRA